ncbi:MAG: hypothetical protein ACE15E_16300 [Acidobacteriota bacterium]
MTARQASKSRKPVARVTWRRREPVRPIGGCQRLVDTTEVPISARAWLGEAGTRNPAEAAERRAESLVKTNSGILRDFKIEADVRRRDGEPVVIFRTQSRVGALPLLSPVTGRPDFGLIIEPRFPWTSIGEVLNATGFRVVPQLLPLPDLPYSDRRIPPWVLSTIVLARMKHLLDQLGRRFVMATSDLPFPKGSVNWPEYAGERLPRAKALSVPCTYPDLRDDEKLRGAIHFVLSEHRSSLMGQRFAGVVVLELLALCEALLARVAGSVPRRPHEADFRGWYRQSIVSRVFSEGLQAIEWTVEERGLAGLSELAGLSWRLDMETFFEGWVETVVAAAGRDVGASVQAGRREQTRVALDWRPSFVGSQRSLLPDVVLSTADTTVVFDAKYKEHGEEIQRSGWRSLGDEVRERHRDDLLQVLAYSALYDTPRVVSCLVYPCRPDTFADLKSRDRVVSRAIVHASPRRRVELALAAIPMAAETRPIVEALRDVVLRPVG